jgi:hypothetical protein
MDQKIEDKKTNWVEWRNERIGAGDGAPQKANLVFGRIAWCNAFDRGDQYKILNETTGTVEDVYVRRETKCLYNICQVFNDAYTAKMLKGDPIPVATPYSTNTEDFDEDLSVATNGAVEHWCKNAGKFPSFLRDTTRAAAVGGIGYAKIVYDKNRKSGIYDGEITLEKVNSLHAYPNADGTNDEEWREFIHRFPKEKSVAEEEFAEQMKSLGITELQSVSKSDAHSEQTEASKKQDFSYNAEVKGTIIQDDIWIKKCKKYPNGKHVILIGEHTLVEEDNPEPDMLPFFAYVVNPKEGELVGRGITYPIIPIQRDMNKLNSIVQENADEMGHLKWMVHENANVLPGAFDDMAGEVVNWGGTERPFQSTASPLPVHITGRFWELMEMAKFITKIQSLDLGTIPRGGSQMNSDTTNRLSESEEVMFAPDVNRMREFVQKIIRRYLFLAKKYYKEERIITIIGENKRPEAVSFFADKLKDDYNVDIYVGQGFEQSKAGKIAAITNLMGTPAYQQSGIDSRLVIEELMRGFNLTKLREDTFKDERQAKRYLNIILAGGKPTVSKYINPNAHLKVVSDYIKQPQYDDLPLEIKAEVDNYMDFLVDMTMPAPQTPPPPGANAPQGAPGNENPVVPNPDIAPNLGGRPPQNMGQAEDMAPQGV